MNHRNPHPRHDQRCGPSTGDIAMLPHQPGRIANSGGQKTGSSPVTLGWGFYQAASQRIERPRWLILVHERVRNAGTQSSDSIFITTEGYLFAFVPLEVPADWRHAFFTRKWDQMSHRAHSIRDAGARCRATSRCSLIKTLSEGYQKISCFDRPNLRCDLGTGAASRCVRSTQVLAPHGGCGFRWFVVFLTRSKTI